MTKVWCLVLAACVAWAGCTKNKVSKVPYISDLVLTPDSIRVAATSEDTAYLQFNFTDGDGDLSAPGGIFVRNLLDTLKPEERFVIGGAQDLDPVVDPELGLKGSTFVVLPAAFFEIADTNIRRDTAQFEVYLRDKAGNQSNRLVSTPLILLNY